ncbi:LGFP repeat-containing protein [Nocardia sp. NBC_00403]|uniref:LGFP repeat-containing protein n=1 Tax=Nocardia sp. NBC_00403 TaxID=2975990 RepID=UPI003FA5A036
MRRYGNVPPRYPAEDTGHATGGCRRSNRITTSLTKGGRYGYPTSDEYDYEGGKAQDFQGGRITWHP